MKNIVEIGATEIQLFNKDALEVICSTPLFNQEEKDEIVSASESMNKAFYNSQVFRTETEARVSVLNDLRFPTPASKYYQCLRELNVHQGELVQLLYDYETKQEDMQIIKAEIDELKDELIQEKDLKDFEIAIINSKINKKFIELKRHKFSLKSLKRTADGRKKEILQWHKIIGELEPLLNKLNIPIDDVNSHQLVSYCARFIKQTVNVIVSGATMASAETNNLVGQLTTTLKFININNQMESVLCYLAPIEQLFLYERKLIPKEIIEKNKEHFEKLSLDARKDSTLKTLDE